MRQALKSTCTTVLSYKKTNGRHEIYTLEEVIELHSSVMTDDQGGDVTRGTH